MQYRVLGKTGLKVSEVGFGGIPILRLPAAEAISILHYAHDQGISFYDTANAYGDSEEKIGQAFADRRDKVIIATKTMKRDKAGAAADIENSLRLLQTDYIDLFQLHQVAQEPDWQKASGPDGCLEAVYQAHKAGKIRHVGITSHSITMALKLIRTGLFTTIQFPFNFIEDQPTGELHPAARELGLGIIGMKPFAGGVIDNAALAFKFLRQYPDVIPIPGFDSVAAVAQIINIYQKGGEINPIDRHLMETYREELGKDFCRRCEYCQPCPHGVMITPSMGYRVVVRRMSPKVAVSFAGKALDTVQNCVGCGICVTRCPYELPIPQILQKHYQMYLEHKAGEK